MKVRVTGGEVDAKYDWPEGILLQGGDHGLVIGRNHADSYSTAFFEAFPDTFIRGEGKTLEEAEDAAWAQWQRISGCPGHEYEARGYTNGCGFCKHCNKFESGVFSIEEVGIPCIVCGVKTNWAKRQDGMHCEEHDDKSVPHTSAIARLFEELAPKEEA